MSYCVLTYRTANTKKNFGYYRESKRAWGKYCCKGRKLDTLLEHKLAKPLHLENEHTFDPATLILRIYPR